MTLYSEEQIFIRAMRCPKCNAAPREHCNRKPRENGTIKNHQERMWAWHQFVKKGGQLIDHSEPSVNFKMNMTQSGKVTLDLIDDEDTNLFR
jgi:hypothetical protein